VTVGRVQLENIAVTDVQSGVTIAGHVVELDPLQFSIYGGRYKGRTTFVTGGRASDVTLEGQYDGLDLNQFLSAASSVKNMIFGRADGTLNIRCRGAEFDEIVRSLNGQGVLSVADGKITSFDLERQIALIGNLAGLPTGAAGTVFRTLRTSVRFIDGRMLTEDVRMDLGDVGVEGHGGLSLGAPVTAEYEFLARLSQELTRRVIPQDAKWSMVGNFFLDEQDRLVVPLKMAGPMTGPRFGLNGAVLKAHMGGTLRRQGERVVEDILKEVLGGRQKKKPN
jgi:hypothetical protein